MAYLLELNERIMDTKTNPKPIQNQLKINLRSIVKWIISYTLGD